MTGSAKKGGMNRPNIFSVCAACFLAISHIHADTTSRAREEERRLADFERRLEEAMVRADVGFLRRAVGDDFRFTHGTGRVTGKRDLLTLTPGTFLSRKVANQEVELHGDVGITSGRILVRTNATELARKIYTVVYVRIYERRGGAWQVISHRTVKEFLGRHERGS